MESLLNNVDLIQKELKSKLKTVSSIYKLDGITLQCKLKSRVKFSDAKAEIECVCKDLQVLPISLEQNGDDKTLFIIQFPELYPLFTQEIERKIYVDNFIWLFNDAIQRNKVGLNKAVINKSTILDGKDTYIKRALGIYCRYHINPYKTSVRTFTDDKEYMSKLAIYFYEALEEFSKENKI